jgi:hypothetical protein
MDGGRAERVILSRGLAAEGEMETRGDEIKRIQACMNALRAIVSLPAVRRGVAPAQIVGTLLDAVVAVSTSSRRSTTE